MLVADGAAAERLWYVLDPKSEMGTLVIAAASNAAGTIHLVYATGYNVDLAGTNSLLQGFLTRGPGKVSLAYGRVATQDLLTAVPGSRERSPSDGQGQALRELVGSHRLEWEYTRTRLPLAVDPASGTVLLAHRWMLRGDDWINLDPAAPYPLGSPPEQIAAARNDRFHAVAVGNIDHRFMGRPGIAYSMLADGLWSAPLWLSLAGTLHPVAATALDMAGTRSGNAFFAWAAQDGFVGRWIAVHSFEDREQQ